MYSHINNLYKKLKIGSGGEGDEGKVGVKINTFIWLRRVLRDCNFAKFFTNGIKKQILAYAKGTGGFTAPCDGRHL